MIWVAIVGTAIAAAVIVGLLLAHIESNKPHNGDGDL